MNRKSLVFTTVASLALVAVAFAMAANKLDVYSEKLNKADGMTMQFTAQALGGSKSAYSFEAAKPNMVRVETPTMLVVSNGKEVTTFMKGLNAFYTEPFSMDAFATINEDKNLVLAKPFFLANGLVALNVSARPSVTRKGVELDVTRATLSRATGLAGTFYTDSDSMVRQAELVLGKDTTLIDVTTINLVRPAAGRFEFKAPKDAKQVEKADLMSAKWYDNVQDALKDAKATNRMVMVKFGFVGCGWCDRLKDDVFATEEFKKRSKQFVFCDIDYVANPSAAQGFTIAGAPDTRFLTADGKEVLQIGGYKPLVPFLADMDKAWSMR